jgi:DNA repair ATPase RecN
MITVQALRAKVDQWHTIRARIKDLEEQQSELNKQLQPITAELVEIMEAMDLTRFEGSMGKINMLTIDYVSNPQTEEDKAAFYNYLKNEGLFEDMVSVHHQRLNSYYKSKLEEAIEKGEQLNIPGLEPKQRKEIRKGR